MEVWTNGAITPKDAIGFAAKLVKDHMSIFINFEEPVETVETPQDTSHDPRLEHLDRSVEELELSVRSYNCLKNANIQTIRELVQKSENEMLKTKNFGRKSLNEIKEILTKMGLSLGMKFDEHGRIIWPPLPSQTAAPAENSASSRLIAAPCCAAWSRICFSTAASLPRSRVPRPLALWLKK
jgi:DNA-directed RNA polymerase subunit alpha